MEHPAYEKYDTDERTFGERLADRVASFIGSWRFILGYVAFTVLWTSINVLLPRDAWDTYPFIFYTFSVSVLAILMSSLILLAGKRQEDRDRYLAAHDYEINKKAEHIIETMLTVLVLMAAKLEVEVGEIQDTIEAEAGGENE